MRKLQMRFLSIDANMFASLLILPIVKVEQLELIGALYKFPFLIPTLVTAAGWQVGQFRS
jgi:hypothetical protein